MVEFQDFNFGKRYLTYFIIVWYGTIHKGMKINFDQLEGFDWDQANLTHIKKHNVDFVECEEVFLNKPLRVNEDNEHSSEKEIRFQVLGKTSQERGLLLAFTIRNNKIRVISARDQNKKERRDYAKTT